MTFTLLSLNSFVQTDAPVEMADILRQDGKIYAVVLGLLVILTGLIFFILHVERKLTKLENENKINADSRV